MRKASSLSIGLYAGILIFSVFVCSASASMMPLTRTGLTGHMSNGGIIGGGAGQVDEFAVKQWITVNQSLILRARAEIDNVPANNGSPAGNVGILYVETGDKGIGAGSTVDVDRHGNPKPGSNEISGGGPHGSEIVSFMFMDDPMLTAPLAALSDSITVQVNEFEARRDDLTVILRDSFGVAHSFGPSVVEPLLVSAGGGKRNKRWNLDFSTLPGIDNIGPLDSFDVRAGVLDPEGKLSGGHFYVSGVDFTSVPEPITLLMLGLGGCLLSRRRLSRTV